MEAQNAPGREYKKRFLLSHINMLGILFKLLSFPLLTIIIKEIFNFPKLHLPTALLKFSILHRVWLSLSPSSLSFSSVSNGGP